MTKQTTDSKATPGVARFELAPGYFLVETSGVSSNARGIRDQVAALWRDVRSQPGASISADLEREVRPSTDPTRPARNL